ncbi:MAG: cupin domain-containing protein [Alphaproteobacteria bacterium]|jgi:mannose-6-phosphate isomerase-like protein (cupin superfamily)|nr:cupin domain-containing protein [Alphaproteobacteria bacterium]
MAVKFIDLLKQPELELGHSKEVLFSSDHFHTWVHGDYPGTKGPMHKHTADQFFYCVQGECTFHFPGGKEQVIGPGQLMLVPKEHLYQLDNTGNEYMILLGARAEPAGNPRRGAKNEVVGDNNYVFENPDKIKVPASKG